MSKPMTSKEARKFLPAFADGELDVEQNLRVLEQMAMDPTNTKRVMHQQQLQQACARVMAPAEMRCPAALRETLSAMAADDAPDAALTIPNDQSSETSGGVLATIGRWATPMAVAAVLALAAVVLLNSSNIIPNANGGYTADGLITASLAERFGQRHVRCSLGQGTPYETELFPADIGELDQALIQHVGRDIDGAALDLTTLGYDYQIAGFCPVPGGESIHVIYKNPNGQSLSLWIKRYDGQPTLDPGIPYVPPTDHTKQPMMVWRDGNMVFYLVGDTMSDVKQAQPQIHLAAAS